MVGLGALERPFRHIDRASLAEWILRRVDAVETVVEPRLPGNDAFRVLPEMDEVREVVDRLRERARAAPQRAGDHAREEPRPRRPRQIPAEDVPELPHHERPEPAERLLNPRA